MTDTRARYGWLADQTDLRLVRSWPDLRLYENLEPVGTAYAPAQQVTVQDWGAVMGLGEHAQLTDLAVSVRNPAPGPVRVPNIAATSSGGTPLPTYRASPVGLDVGPSGTGWIALSQPYDPSWRLNGTAPISNLGVTNLFVVPPESGASEIRYTRWPLARASYLLSALGVFAALIAAAFGRMRRRRSTREERA